MTTHALIDSPYQLLSLIEARHAGVLPDMPIVHLRGRRHSEELIQLGSHLLGDVVDNPGWSVTMLRQLRRSDVLVVGDAFSSLVHATVPLARGTVVVLEDGASALRATRALAGHRGDLARAHARTPRSRLLARLGKLGFGRVARSGQLVMFGALPMPGEDRAALERVGVRVVRHRFDWCRTARHSTPSPLDGATTVVVGSALAIDGFIDRGWYENWVAEAVGCARAVVVPHRRERVGESGSSMLLCRTSLPIELEITRCCDDVRVHTLPATPALTVPIARPGARLVCEPIPDHVWRDVAPPSMRALAEQIAALSRPAGGPPES